MKENRYKNFLLAAAVSCVLMAGLTFTTPLMTYDTVKFYAPLDHHKYIYMAQFPFKLHIAPFCWRILNPLLVRILPFSLPMNFLFISLISLIATGILSFSILKKIKKDFVLSLAGVILFFSLSWATRIPLFDFWLPDSLAFLFMAGGIYAILINKDYLFFLCLTLGVLVKESVIFIVPLYYTLKAKRLIERRLLAKTALIAGIPILLLFSLRHFIEPLNGNPDYMARIPSYLMGKGEMQPYSLTLLFRTIGLERIKSFSFAAVRQWTLEPFSLLAILLALISLKKNMRLFVRLSPFLLLVYSQLFFAHDTQRLLVYGFFAVLILAIEGLGVLRDRLNLSPFEIIMLPLLSYTLNIVFNRHLFPPLPAQIVVLILWGLAITLRKKRGRLH